MSSKLSVTVIAAILITLGCVQAARASSFCQHPNQSVNEDNSLFLRSSTLSDHGLRIADDAAFSTAVSVDRVRWWGVYVDGATVTECPAPESDEFEIRLYEDDGTGLPGTLVHESVVTAVDRQATGLTLIDPQFHWPYAEYEYSAHLDGPVALTPDTDYWLSIYSANDPIDVCYWAWETAPDQNQSAQWSSDTGMWQAGGGDFAFCLSDGAGIPALSTWGVLVVMLLIAVAGTIILRRRLTVGRHWIARSLHDNPSIPAAPAPAFR